MAEKTPDKPPVPPGISLTNAGLQGSTKDLRDRETRRALAEERRRRGGVAAEEPASGGVSAPSPAHRNLKTFLRRINGQLGGRDIK